MNFLPRLRSWWKALTHPTQISDDASAELQFHIDARAGDLVRRGVSRQEAARQARIELGQAATQGEKYREAIGLRPLDELSGDIRYGIRSFSTIPLSRS